MFTMMNLERIVVGIQGLGLSEIAYQNALNYSKERKQFGKALADFQSIQFKIADMTTELEASRLMVHRAASSIDNGDPDVTMHCAMAKRWATEACSKICNDALQIHGGYGYLKDFGIEKIVRDLRVHEILEGTNEIMRLIIARQILN